MLPHLMLLVAVCWAAAEGMLLGDLWNTTLMGDITRVEANNKCNCRNKCFVRLDCRGASFTSQEECHQLLGQTGSVRLVTEQGSHSWYKYVPQEVKKFFLTAAETNNGTIASQQFTCQAEGGLATSILTQEDWNTVQADILPELSGTSLSSTYYAWIPLIKTGSNGYKWQDGSSVLASGVFTASQVGVSPYATDIERVNGRVTKPGTISMMNTPGVNSYKVLCLELPF